MLPTVLASRRRIRENGSLPLTSNGRRRVSGRHLSWSLSLEERILVMELAQRRDLREDDLYGTILDLSEINGLTVNPSWVEWFMGLPEGWTDE